MWNVQGRSAVLPLLICSLLPLFSLSCSGRNSPNNPDEEIAAAVLRISVFADSHFSVIAESAVVVVSGVDFDPIRHPLVLTDSGLAGNLDSIPVGRNP